jgi:hypothetical protein
MHRIINNMYIAINVVYIYSIKLSLCFMDMCPIISYNITSNTLKKETKYQ